MIVQTSPGGPPQIFPSMSFGVRTLACSTAEYVAHISWFRYPITERRLPPSAFAMMSGAG